MPRLGYVYFVQGENGLIKIGHTGAHPDYRIASLRAQSPVGIKTLRVLRGDMDAERRCHEMFAWARQHGEWFRPMAELLLFIKKHTKPWPKPSGVPVELISWGERFDLIAETEREIARWTFLHPIVSEDWCFVASTG
jgi:hypothetical protein